MSVRAGARPRRGSGAAATGALASVVVALACGGDAPDERGRPESPLSALGEPTVHLGDARAGDVLRHRFHFVNASAAPLELGAVRQSCGCTEALLSGRELAPGEIGHLDVRVDTYQRSGTLEAEIELLEPGAPERSWLAFRVRAEIAPAFTVTVEPGVVDLGELAPEASATVRVAVRSTASRSVEPLLPLVTASAPDTRCRVLHERVTRGETRTVLELSAIVELDLRDVAGRYERRVAFRLEPPDRDPVVATLLVRGVALAPIRTEPADLFVGLVDGRAEVRRSVALHLGDAPGPTTLRPSQPWIRAAIEPPTDGGGPSRLVLTLAPPAGSGWFEEWVELVSGEARLRLPVRGILR